MGFRRKQMDAKALTPRDLFDGKVIYEVPSFQRPYVWTEEDQWQPLWEDVQRVTEAVIESDGDTAALDRIAGHFLGAVVLKQLESPAGEPGRWSVIDGQQRLTTLQLLLDAAQLVVADHGDEDDSETLLELVENGARRFMGTARRFKLWPSRIDRSAFEAVMDNRLKVPRELEDSRIAQAHRFFQHAVLEWLGDEETVEKMARLAALTEVLEQYLQLVAITLGTHDDLIFETLNDRGTPLLAADLIKNFVFDRCEKIGADVDAWADVYWADFDGDWWREQVSQGRLYRSRIDLFLQYWLTMRTMAEVPTDAVFSHFRDFAQQRLITVAGAEAFLKELRSDAETFRDLASLDPGSPGGRFYSRVVESLELGAFIPLLLWMISDNHEAPAEQVEKALAAVESWAVRRTLLRWTMKDINRMVVSLLQEIAGRPLETVGDATVDYLARQTADARAWPSDEQIMKELPDVRLYGNLKQQRLRAILSALELKLRTARHEEVTLPEKLDIEHVMPRGWRIHWGDGVREDAKQSADRDRTINTLGNLTLVTRKLNAALSNRPWTDGEAAVVAPTGKDAGLGKRSLVGRYSVLVLNKEIVDGHPERWTEADIRRRSEELAEVVTRTWPCPRAAPVPAERR
jgi:hypothetical protein